MKVCSITAAMATMAFNKFFIEEAQNKFQHIEVDEDGYSEEDKKLFEAYTKAIERGAMFDSRCFNIPKEEVVNCIYWRHVDAERNSVQMVGLANFSAKELEHKSRSMIKEMLLEQKEKQDFYKRHFRKSYNPDFVDYVCVTQMGDILRPAYVTQRFKDLLNKYGLRHIRFHDLRHTFASLLLTKDVPLINVSKFLGHSDLSTTANIYAHFDTESKQASADVITDILTKKSNNV
jgi:integrase